MHQNEVKLEKKPPISILAAELRSDIQIDSGQTNCNHTFIQQHVD